MVFIKKLEAFQSLPYQQFSCENKHDIYFADETIFAKYRYGMVSDCVASLQPVATRTDNVLYVCHCHVKSRFVLILVNLSLEDECNAVNPDKELRLFSLFFVENHNLYLIKQHPDKLDS